MKYSFDVKISEHIWEDTLGQLICIDAVIAREGFQEYYEDDILRNGSFKIVKVERPWDEVSKSAPTFEAKPIIIQHPDKNIDISVKNMKEYKVGHMQNVRPSEFEGVKVLIADLVFDDPDAIKKVKSGELRELSCGYFYEIDSDKMKQYDIKGEHLALVDQGRAGIAKIIDSKSEIFELHKYLALKSKEKKDAFMQKISTEVLEGIKKYYYTNEEEVFSPEEIEMTIKIVERELNTRTNNGMGLSKDAINQNKASDSPYGFKINFLEDLGYTDFKYVNSSTPVYGNQKTNTAIIIDNKNQIAYKTNLIKEYNYSTKRNQFTYASGKSIEFTQEEKNVLEKYGYSLKKMKGADISIEQNKTNDTRVEEMKNLGYVFFAQNSSTVFLYGNQKTNSVIIIDSGNKYAYKSNLIEEDNKFTYDKKNADFTTEEKELIESTGFSLQKMKEKAKDEELLGGLADGMSIREIAEKHGISERIIRRQLQKGIKHEMEHTYDREKAKEIAMDHLYETSNYYTKLSKMEEKAEDLYIEDDKITMNFEEDDLAWTTIMAKDAVKGDIISTIKSIRPFEVTEVREKDGEIKLYLISTDENFQKTINLDQEDSIDILIFSETGKKVLFNENKAEDQRVLEKVKDLQVGDVTLIGGVKYNVTLITKNKQGRYYIMSDDFAIYKDANGEDLLQK